MRTVICATNQSPRAGGSGSTRLAQRLRALSEQLIGAQEGERKRIAVELHDSVGQSLSAVKYSWNAAWKCSATLSWGSSTVFQLAVKRIQETAESIPTSQPLRPRILDELGAASAAVLSQLCGYLSFAVCCRRGQG
jgi:signal transduction histidine kinase